MNFRITTAALLLSTFAICESALADCPLGSAYDAGKAYEKGQVLEKQGKKEEALQLYVRAQQAVCDDTNPYAAPAAKRGAPLGLELGAAAEKAGDFHNAYGFYDQGGHFALADAAMMHTVRAERDNTSSYVNARKHFEDRAQQTRSGSYTPDAKLVAEVAAMPKQAIDRAWKTELASYNEQYLADMVQISQSQTSDLSDMAAMQRAGVAQSALAQKWKYQDLMQLSEDSLDRMRRWATVSGDAALEKSTLAQVTQRAEHHVQALTQKFSGSPGLLEKASAFVPLIGLDAGKEAARIAAIKAQANRLGDESNGKQRYLLAIAYYNAAGERAKSEAVQARASQLAMQKMQPSIDQAQKQAEEFRKQYGDPAKVQAMRDQAEAARKAMQQQQAQANAKSASNKKSSEQLEKELGL
jgi:hypothetical protein